MNDRNTFVVAGGQRIVNDGRREISASVGQPLHWADLLKKEVLTWDDIITTESWRKRHIKHFMLITDEMYPERRIRDIQGVTHLVLIEGPPGENADMMWGHQRINGNWYFLYSNDNTPVLMHCEACAGVWADWVLDMQREWREGANYEHTSNMRH